MKHRNLTLNIVALAVLVGCSEASSAEHTQDAGVADADVDAAASSMDAATSSVEAAADLDASTGTDALLSDDGSSPNQATRRRQLVDHMLWTRSEPSTDPFSDRPATFTCARLATMAEPLAGEPAFGIETGQCEYLTVQQTTTTEILKDEIIKVRLWHFDLTYPEAATAHAALLVDGVTIVDEHVDIPSPGGLIVKNVAAPRNIAMGAPVFFHLHNHGANSWALVEVSAGP